MKHSSIIPEKCTMFIHYIRHHHENFCVIEEYLIIWEFTGWNNSK